MQISTETQIVTDPFCQHTVPVTQMSWASTGGAGVTQKRAPVSASTAGGCGRCSSCRFS